MLNIRSGPSISQEAQVRQSLKHEVSKRRELRGSRGGFEVVTCEAEERLSEVRGFTMSA